jgi:peptidyl-dipeptidase Dcp
VSFSCIFLTRTQSFTHLRNKLFMSSLSSNPLTGDWSSREHGLPPFGSIQADHYEEALKLGMEKNIQELDDIARNTEFPTFENTIESIDAAGGLMEQVAGVFYNLCSSNSPPELQAVETRMAGPLASHGNRVYTYPGLFIRVTTVYEARFTLNLSPEQLRLVETMYKKFVRSGAKFTPDAQVRYSLIVEELAKLCTEFAQNVMADESEITLDITAADLAGLPDDLIAAAKQASFERKKTCLDENDAKRRKVEETGEESYAITLSRSLVVPFITFSERRDLREKVAGPTRLRLPLILTLT